MKSYNHLYEQCVSEENYMLAVKNATRNKSGKRRKGRRIRYYRTHAQEIMPEMMHYAKHFTGAKHTPKVIYDGIRRKQRNIIVPTMREQIVHHMIVNVLKPIILKPMYEHAYGSIPKRGALGGSAKKGTKSGKKAVEAFIRKHPKDCKYCLKMDIAKFFDSVPHDLLKERFARIIHDNRFLNVLNAVIDSGPGDRGIPIGFYTSQWFANFYLTELDHFMKEQLGAKGYFRYMDDMVVFDGNKRRLHRIRKETERFLLERLGLEMNGKWQVFLFHYVRKDGRETGRMLDFMGFRFYRNRTTLRRKLFLRMRRKAKRICRKQIRTVYDCRQMLSCKGWLTSTDTYVAYRKYIKPYVSFRYLRKRISMAQRLENGRKKQCGTGLRTEAT